MSLRYCEQYPIFHFSKFDFPSQKIKNPSQKVIFWDIIFFIHERYILFGMDRAVPKGVTWPRGNIFFHPKKCHSHTTSNDINQFFSPIERKYVPNTFIWIKILSFRRVRVFRYVPSKRKLKGQCFIIRYRSFPFELLTIFFYTIRTRSNSYRQNRSLQFERHERDGSFSLYIVWTWRLDHAILIAW